MEINRPNIRLPAIFTCSMTCKEAIARMNAAKRHHPGVMFTLEGRTFDKRLIGRTVLTNLSSFDEFNQEIFPDSKEKFSSGGRKPSS